MLKAYNQRSYGYKYGYFTEWHNIYKNINSSPMILIGRYIYIEVAMNVVSNLFIIKNSVNRL